jgi:hypothetical protein
MGIRVFKRTFLPILFLISNLSAQSVNLPLDHWAYPFFERMEAKSVLTGMRDGSRPISRQKAADWVKSMEIISKSNPKNFSNVDKAMLERLKGEFRDELQSSTITFRTEEWEPHLYSWKDSTGYVHVDGLAGGVAILRDDGANKDERHIFAPYVGGIIRGRIRGLGFYSDNRIFTEWGRGKYIQNYKASDGYPQNVDRDSTRATWDTSDSYFSFQVQSFRFQIGRDRLRWGPCFFSGLMFSGLAPSFDLVKVQTETRAATFTWMHGELRSDCSHKWISAHRLEISLCKGIDIGLNEAVIYGNRGIETAYLNPFIPYLFAEHTLGDRDNVVMGFDMDITKIPSLKFYSEFFIDDLFAPWEFFSKYWGNKFAFTVGGLWIDPFGLEDSGFRWEYSRIEPYVYTHRDTVNVFEHYNFGLGHFLQPNSEGFFFQAEHRFSLALAMTMNFYSTKHGEGDRRIPHTEQDGTEKQFLCGIIEKRNRFGVQIEWEIVRDVRFRGELARILETNCDHIIANNQQWTEALLSVAINW